MAKTILSSKHHYTSEQLTGLTKEESKLKSILFEFQVNHITDWKNNEAIFLNPKINRRDLSELISKALTQLSQKPTDKRTVWKYISFLLDMGYISHNPSSDITPNKHILPTNDTRYFLNSNMIEPKSVELSVKSAQHYSITNQVQNVEPEQIGKVPL